jgi:hypothetical protein
LEVDGEEVDENEEARRQAEGEKTGGPNRPLKPDTGGNWYLC